MFEPKNSNETGDSQEIVKVEDKELSSEPQKGLSYTKDQIKLIKETVAVGTTNAQLKLFLHQCLKTRLDPLANQIYCILRKTKITVWENGKKIEKYVDKMNVQTGIDGFRVVAERSNKYAGQDEPVFTYVLDKDGKPTDVIIKAMVTVYRFQGDNRYPAGIGIAHFEEYKPSGKGDFMWKDKPHVMIAKCAEAQALRKAFPQDLSGVYVDEEMAKFHSESIKKVEQLPTKDIKIAAELMGRIESLNDKDKLDEIGRWIDKTVGQKMSNGHKLTAEIARHLKVTIKQKAKKL